MAQQMTKNQHYIPQCYLRNFSSSPKGINRFDLSSYCNNSIWVPIDKECCDKYLYEYFDSNGKIVEQNRVENLLSIYEGTIASTIKSIQAKAQNIQNTNPRHFLSLSERKTLITFVCLQIIRKPESIKAGEETAKEVLPFSIDDRIARNFTLYAYNNSLSNLERKDLQQDILNRLIRWFDNSAFKIGIADSDLLYTCDNPIRIYNVKELHPQIDKPDIVIFPLTSRLVLYLSPKSWDRPKRRNVCFQMSNADIKAVNTSTLLHANRWAYSYNPLSREEVEKLIRR